MARVEDLGQGLGVYVPAHFEAPGLDAMHALIRTRPLATLVLNSTHGLEANHVPLLLSTGPEPRGRLQGHVARNNPMWRRLSDETQALAIFHGADSYVSPSWYPTKQAHGKVVPTWNYVVVHAQGRLRAIEDKAWIRSQIEALTAQQEAGFAVPWQVGDAPADFIAGMLDHIVGIELVIDRLQGKWKVSQNQPAQNRQGVIQGLETCNDAATRQMAALIAGASGD